MFTNVHLLELLTQTYHSKGGLTTNENECSIIAEASQYLSDLGEIWVNINVLDHILNIFKPLFIKWNPSQGSSVLFEILPILINAILKSIVSVENFNPQVTFENIWTVEHSEKYPLSFKKDNNGKYCIALLLESEKIYVSKWFLSNSLFINGVDESNWFDIAIKIMTLKKANQLEFLEIIINNFPDFYWESSSSTERNKAELNVQKAIFESYWEFFINGLLIPENMPCIKILLKPTYYEDGINILKSSKEFLSLEDNGDLTSEDKELIGGYKHYQHIENARAHLSILAKLKRNGLLNEKYKTIALTCRFNSFGLDEGVCDSLINLKEANLLNEENELAIRQANHVALFAPVHVAKLIIYFDKLNRLTSEVRKKYLTHKFLTHLSQYYKIFHLLARLDHQELLADNIDFVLNNASLLMKDPVENALKKIPDHWLTQEIWGEIVKIIQQNTEDKSQLSIESIERLILTYLRTKNDEEIKKAIIPFQTASTFSSSVVNENSFHDYSRGSMAYRTKSVGKIMYTPEMQNCFGFFNIQKEKSTNLTSENVGEGSLPATQRESLRDQTEHSSMGLSATH